MTRYTFSLWFFNLYIGYIIRYAGLHNSQAGIQIAGRNINNHRDEDDTDLIAESKKETKKPLDEGRRCKNWFKTQNFKNYLQKYTQHSWPHVTPLHGI